jgi:hypothetical protein
MRVFNHAFNTWMLAQLLHPIIFYAYFSIVLKESLDPGALVSLLVGASIIAAPSLFISFLFLRLIAGKKMPTPLSLFTWVVVALVSIVLNIALFLLLFKSSIIDIPFDYILPAFIAALVAILIRLPLFIKLNEDIKYQANNNSAALYENQV